MVGIPVTLDPVGIIVGIEEVSFLGEIVGVPLKNMNGADVAFLGVGDTVGIALISVGAAVPFPIVGVPVVLPPKGVGKSVGATETIVPFLGSVGTAVGDDVVKRGDGGTVGVCETNEGDNVVGDSVAFVGFEVEGAGDVGIPVGVSVR